MDYLIALRWPEGFLCPACKTATTWRNARGLLHCKEFGLS
ncbi:MAG: transposase [Deltaproteobacteria bacterium]|nr:transposase [Deltaproteobacteria bacterium]